MQTNQLLAGAQAATFITTGVWPIVSLRTFEAVTGRKDDHWLVQTVGALIASVGCALAAGASRRVTRETALLGASASAALAACDVTFVARGRISRIYLVDALLEGAFAVAWLALWPRSDRPPRGARTRESRTNARKEPRAFGEARVEAPTDRDTLPAGFPWEDSEGSGSSEQRPPADS
jgi:hypothetical protein